MDSEEETLEMSLLPDQDPTVYRPILDSLRSRHLYVFKSQIRRCLYKKPPGIDINYVFPHPDLKTFLDEACTENLSDFVEFLLAAGADPNRLNEDLKRAPIHFAAENDCPDALKALVRDPNIQPNLVASGLTALHFAVQKDSLECAKILLDAGASPNIPNTRGMTALHLAASKNQRAMVSLILEASFKNLDLDSYKDFKGLTARKIIEEKFPDLQLPEEGSNPDDYHVLKYHIHANDEDSFLKKLQNIDHDKLRNTAELLSLSVEHNLKQATRELIRRGALKIADSQELAKLAIAKAHCDILRQLLRHDSSLGCKTLLLPACQELGVPCKPGPNGRDNRLECLRLVLTHGCVEVDIEDDKGNSPLHYAARAESREAVELLLRKGSYIGHTNHFGVPPLAHITPDVLENHLNYCLSTANERSEEFEIVIDYRNLQPHGAQSRPNHEKYERIDPNQSTQIASETEALLYISRDKSLRHLLKHPVLASFLNLKWHRIRHILYANFLFYLVFFMLVNTYILRSIRTDEDQPEGVNNQNQTSNVVERAGDNSDASNLNFALLTLSWVFLGILGLREILQFFASPCHYLSSPENWLEITLIGVVSAALFSGDAVCQAVAILLTTWELVILLGQHPKMAVDIEMFKTVSLNFFKCLCLYALVIVAFALAFFVMFGSSAKDAGFPDPQQSIFKTIVMFTGEFEAANIPFGENSFFSHLVFVAFVFLIAIVLLNLLNGLAVNDTGEILAEAELVCLVSRTKLLAYVERIAVGAKFFPRYRLCCCLNFLQRRPSKLGSPRIGYLARRILLFPRYLPHGKLSVKPHKNNQILLHGRSSAKGSLVKMEPGISKAARQIIRDRERESTEDKIMGELLAVRRKLDRLNKLVVATRSMPEQDIDH